MKLRNCCIVLLFLVLCLFLFPIWAGAQKLDLSPYMVVSKNKGSEIKVNNGHGIMLHYSIFEQAYGDFGLFGSLDMQGVELDGHSAGNLNTIMFGPAYRTPTFWNYFDVSMGGGYAKAHDSDLEDTRTNKYMARTRVQVIVPYAASVYCPPPLPPVFIYREQTRTVLTKADFEDGWGLWATLNFAYPIAKRQTLGLRLGGRYVCMGVDSERMTSDASGIHIEDTSKDIEPFSYMGMLTWRIMF